MDVKEIFKKNKLFLKKGLTNEKTFAIIDKPTSREHLGRGTCSLKIEQQRKFFSTCKCERISLMFSWETKKALFEKTQQSNKR